MTLKQQSRPSGATLASSEPTIKEIVRYWASRKDESGLAVDWCEAHERCWRCGYKAKLQKCHIVPKSRKGKLAPKNLVLLCKRCHRDAPNVADARFMWIWLRATCVPFYETWIWSRAFEEYEKMFGRMPFEGVDVSAIDEIHLRRILRPILSKTIIHYGEGHKNAATLACILARIEERVTNQKLKGVETSSQAKYFFMRLFGSNSDSKHY